MASPGLPTSAFAREFSVFAGLIGDALRRPVVKSVRKWQDRGHDKSCTQIHANLHKP